MTRARAWRTRGVLLGACAAVLGACTTAPTRVPMAPPGKPEEAPAAPVAAPSSPVDAAPAIAATPPTSPWSRVRRRLALPDCDYRPDVQRWARYYTHSPRPFIASWKRAMPFLLLVLKEIERRDLPGEFALLPYLESNYRPVSSQGDRAAGMWQLVPDTARSAGLVVTANYDERLDALASTAAAFDLIEHYEREFSDWRLADMAFNAGEFRTRKLLAGRDPHALSADELSRLAFSPLTHEHLDRLLALACIVDDPQRFGVHLPEPTAADNLQSVTLAAGMDLRLAARLAGLDADDVRRWNAQYRGNRMPADTLHRLLLPAPRADEFRAAAAAVPIALWDDWHQQQAARTSSIGTWAVQLGVPVAVLAAANAIDTQATVTSSTQLLLPGREPEHAPARHADAHARTHLVVAGDTLSRIARRYAMPLRRLRQLNPQAATPLRPGDRLQLGLADN